jgi:hypothetical protein
MHWILLKSPFDLSEEELKKCALIFFKKDHNMQHVSRLTCCCLHLTEDEVFFLKSKDNFVLEYEITEAHLSAQDGV